MRAQLAFCVPVMALLLMGVASGESPSAKWEQDIAAFEAADKQAPPPRNAILFIGSSTIRMWTTLADDFPKHTVINRGFGGSELADAVHFADRIVIPYKPRLIVLFAGTNDISNGKSPEQVRDDLRAFVAKVRTALPDARIAYLGISPAPVRWDQADKQKETNRLIKEFIGSVENMMFINQWDQFLGADGKPREELYLSDRLHSSEAGYRIRAEIVRPHLGEPDKK
jgi:lysophospholipase L1-like esterase